MTLLSTKVQTDKQTNRHTDDLIRRHAHKQTCRQVDKHTRRQTDKQTSKTQKTDTQTKNVTRSSRTVLIMNGKIPSTETFDKKFLLLLFM